MFIFCKPKGGPARLAAAPIRERSAAALLCCTAWSASFAVSVAACPQPLPNVSKDFVESSFRFDSNGGAVLLPVTFNGRRFQFVVDTASAVTGFDSSFSAELGDPLPAHLVITALGAARLDRFHAPAARVGPYPMTGVLEVYATDLSRLRSIAGSDFYGYLGLNFLREHIVRIDCDRGEVTFMKEVPSDAGSSLPLTVSPLKSLTVSVDLGGKEDVPFMIATAIGSDGTIDSGLVDRLIQSGKARYVGTALFDSAGDSRRVQQTSVRSFRAGEFRHRDLVFTRGDSNLLGLGYLSRFIVTMDFPRKTMYLKPGARHNEPSRYDLSGAHILRPHESTTIESVDQASASEVAGLRANDILEQIDERPAASLTLPQVRMRLCTPGRHTLQVKRGAESLRIGLNLKRPNDPWAGPPGTDRPSVAPQPPRRQCPSP